MEKSMQPDKTILLLGADEISGYSYTSAIREDLDSCVKIIGVGIDKFRTEALRHSHLFDEVILCEENLSSSAIYKICLEHGVDFIYAQNSSWNKKIHSSDIPDYIFYRTFGNSDKVKDFHFDVENGPEVSSDEWLVQMFFIDGELFHSQQLELKAPHVYMTTNYSDIYMEVFETIIGITEDADVIPNGVYSSYISRDEFDNPIVTSIQCGRYVDACYFFARFGMNTPTAELEYVTTNTKPLKKLALIRSGIIWVRSLDAEPMWYTIEDLEGE